MQTFLIIFAIVFVVGVYLDIRMALSERAEARTNPTDPTKQAKD